MISLVKNSLRLLLRNKWFIFFLLATPVLSTVLLSIKMNHTVYGDTTDNFIIIELPDYSEKAVYVGNTSACIIKVYDASGTELSDFVLQQIADTGMFSVCRCDVTGFTSEEVQEIAKKDAYDDRAAVLLYLQENFDEAVMNGEPEQGLTLYSVSADERQELFVEELTLATDRIAQVQTMTGKDAEGIMAFLDDIRACLPEGKRINYAGSESVEMTQKQVNQHTQMGYAFAVLTLGFLFCGVCVAHSVIEEKNNKVFTRIMLTKASKLEYFLSKFVMALIITGMQTLVLAVCLALIPGLDVGISYGSLLLIIFLLGLISSTLSLLMGVLIGDVMSSNYAVFAVWSISALLSGLYFPLENTTPALNTISYFMPQRWFMDASKLLIVGDKSAFGMILCVTVAYLIVVISVGGVGLKIKRYE